jgi:MFS family permease
MTDGGAQPAGEGAATALLPSRRCGSSGNLYLYSLAAVASVGGFLFGYDTGVVSGAMSLIRPEWDLNDVQHEAIVSSTTAFAAVGASISGVANRLLGRRPVLLLAASIFVLGALMMALARVSATRPFDCPSPAARRVRARTHSDAHTSLSC